MQKLPILFLTLAIHAILYSAPASGKSIKDPQQLQNLYQQEFLNAQHNVLDLAVCQVLIASRPGMNPNELKERFKQSIATPEMQQRFLSIYASIFKEQDLQQALSLIQDERYLEFRRKLSLANDICFQESTKILGELIADGEPAEPEKAKKASIIHVHANTFEDIINSSKPVILEAYTSWCGPCKHMAVLMKELNQQFGDVYQFAKMNAEKEKSLTKTLGISAYPTVIFFKDGEEVGRVKGYINKEAFIAKIKQFFG